MTPGPGIEPGTQRWEESTCTTVPSLLPLNIFHHQLNFLVKKELLHDNHDKCVFECFLSLVTFYFKVNLYMNEIWVAYEKG